MYAAARAKRANLHQIHKVCNTRIKQPLFCPHCNRIVERSEIVKGYEYEKGQYVVIEPDEIKKITPASGHTMEILTFLDGNEVDPIYFESSFMAMPEPHAEKAYLLLLKALEDTNKVGIAKVTMHQREYTVFIRPRDHGLTLHTMFYQNEIASVEGYGKKYDIKLKPEEVKLANQLVESLSAPFKPAQYRDEFQARLNDLIEAKLRGPRGDSGAQGTPSRPGNRHDGGSEEESRSWTRRQARRQSGFGRARASHPPKSELDPLSPPQRIPNCLHSMIYW